MLTKIQKQKKVRHKPAQRQKDNHKETNNYYKDTKSDIKGHK